MSQFEMLPVPQPPSPTRRRWSPALGLLAAGAVAGGIIGAVISANAESSGSLASLEAASTPTPTSTAYPRQPHGYLRLNLTGTVTAVGSATVTIKTSSGTKTYTVNANSDIDKNGEAKLSDIKVGDAVRFSTTTAGGTVIAVLHAGNEALNQPRGHGPGAGRFGLSLSGTVTAVGSSTVTIKTSSGTTTYTVNAKSDIDKNGEAKLSDLKVGDSVRFSTTTTGGNVIAILHAGDEALDQPSGFPHR
jgi:Cu/Ag efflux protein CusF